MGGKTDKQKLTQRETKNLRSGKQEHRHRDKGKSARSSQKSAPIYNHSTQLQPRREVLCCAAPWLRHAEGAIVPSARPSVWTCLHGWSPLCSTHSRGKPTPPPRPDGSTCRASASALPLPPRPGLWVAPRCPVMSDTRAVLWQAGGGSVIPSLVRVVGTRKVVP